MIRKLDPEVAAEHVFTAHKHEGAWLDAFTENLGRRRARPVGTIPRRHRPRTGMVSHLRSQRGPTGTDSGVCDMVPGFAPVKR